MSVIENFLIGLDQAFNCLIKLDDGWGKPDESISARAWRLRRKHPTLRAVIDGLFFWQPNHCESSFWSEVGRLQLPTDYQDVD